MKEYYKYSCFVNVCYQIEVKDYYRRVRRIYKCIKSLKQKIDRVYNIADNIFLCLNEFNGKFTNLLGKINFTVEN